MTLLPETPRDGAALTPHQSALAQSALDVVERAARRMLRRYADVLSCGELVSEGNRGLLAAARAFDPERKVPFGRFAARYVIGRMKNAIGTELRERRRHRELDAGPVGEGRSSSDAGPIFAEPTANLAGEACRASRAGEALVVSHEVRSALRDAIEDAIEELPSQQGRLVILHYKEGRTLEEISKLLGIGYATAKRWNAAVVNWIRERLRELRGTPVPMSNGNV